MKLTVQRSELEAVSLEALSEVGLHFVLHGLSAEVLIEDTGSAAERVLRVLVVVRLQVADKSASHVGVVLARTERGEEHGTGLLVEVCTEAPSGGNDQEEVEHDQGDTLLGLLDEGRVQMHVVLGGEIVIQHGVDILKLHEAGVLVRLAKPGVGSVEVAGPRGESEGGGERASAEGLGEKVEVRISTHI